MSPEYATAREAFVYRWGTVALKFSWSQGALLSTAQTRRWTEEQQRQADAREKLCAFAHFKSSDEGRSRLFVYEFESVEVCQRVITEHNATVWQRLKDGGE